VNNWSFDIVRQGSWDLWVWVCLLAAGVLLTYAVLARLWSVRRGRVALVLVAVGVVGTLAVVFLERLHRPAVGMVWTFILLSLLSATFYLNLQPQLGTRRTGTLLALRVIALAMLVPMLFEPVIRYVSRPKPERPLLILVDTSGSMSFPDQQNGPTRLQSVWRTLSPQLQHIGDHFIPHIYTFSTDFKELTTADELAVLQADGKATDLVGGISKALQQTTNPQAAVLLLSDGIDNASPGVADAIRAARRPIHTLTVGSDQTEPATLSNVAVENIETGDDFVVDHESKVKVTIKSTALANRVIDVNLTEVDADGKYIGQVVTNKLVLQPLPDGQSVDLPYKPLTIGVHRLRVWVDEIVGERSFADNRQEFQGLALDPRIKILYVEGRARPEYRELNRALSRDSNVEIVSLLRIQQDRFAASGQVDGQKVSSLPTTTDEWKKFDVVILGDLDSSFLTKLQQDQIEAFVSNGGSLLMIGGQTSFGPGGYQDSPVEKALPVFVGGLGSEQEKSAFVPQLTPEGQAHPMMEALGEWFTGQIPADVSAEQGSLPDARAKKRGSELFQDSSDKPTNISEPVSPTRNLPALRGNVVVAKPKSGAQVLLIHPDRTGPDGQPQIVLAAHLYGEGRAAAFTADTTYLWYLPLRGMGQDSPYNRFWGQLVRWLAGEDVRNRQRGSGVEGLLNKSLYQLGEPVRIRAMVRDDKGDATRYAQVSLILKGNGPDRQLALVPMESRAGMFDVTIPALDKGDYDAEVVATKDGKELGRQKLTFTVIPPADELLKIAANPKLMQEIADATKGFNYPLAQLPTLIDELIRSDPNAVVARQETVPLANYVRAGLAFAGRPPHWPKKYDLPLQGFFVLALLTTEWILRRRWQLP